MKTSTPIFTRPGRMAILTLLLSLTALFDARSTKADTAGDFDYYLLALSWSPSYCADDARQGKDELQCFSQREYGFIIHGLWPQYEQGYPSYCRTNYRAPSGELVEEMLRYAPSKSLIHHAWDKHGSCSGLDPLHYFRLAVKSFKAIDRPTELTSLHSPLLLTVRDIEHWFHRSNPHLPENSLYVTCKKQKLREIRVCLEKDGTPRSCSSDALKSRCQMKGKLRVLAMR